MSAVYILVGMDPLNTCDIDFIQKFNSFNDVLDFLHQWLSDELNKQTNFVSGVKGDISKHVSKYISHFSENYSFKFYGEYQDQYISSEPYDYKFTLYKL